MTIEATLPTEVDWTDKGAVSPVENQGVCGSCWAYSTAGAVESAYFLKTGTMTPLSKQQMVSCIRTCQGCSGCYIDRAFNFIIANKGLATQSDYPYTSGSNAQEGTCRRVATLSAVTPKSYVDVPPNNVNAMKAAVAIGPVAIAVQANQNEFQYYKSGIISSGCGQNLDHAVLLVGYGTSNGTPYWKVKHVILTTPHILHTNSIFHSC